MTPERAIALGRLVLAFGRVNRSTFHEDGLRPETDTDHTVMLMLIAMEQAPVEDLDSGLVLKLALVHDLPEAKCGDVNSFGISAAGRSAKAEREAAAIAALDAAFPGADFVTWIRMYERQEVPEARFVRYLDKALPKITHYLNGCQTLKNMGVSKSELDEAHDTQFADLEAYAIEFPATAKLLRSLMDMSVG